MIKKFQNNHLILFALHPTLYMILSVLILFLTCERDISGINNYGPSLGPDTTSHNYVWTIDTIDTFGSRLFDVFAIDEDDYGRLGRSTPQRLIHLILWGIGCNRTMPYIGMDRNGIVKLYLNGMVPFIKSGVLHERTFTL